MKYLLLIGLIICATLNLLYAYQEIDSIPNDKKEINYTEEHLEDFLDSIGILSPNLWIKQVSFRSDSAFRNQQLCNELVNDNDFKQLKAACKRKSIAVELARRIFKDSSLVSPYGDGMIDLTFFPFDKNKYAFNEYATCLGSVYGESAKIFFFKSNRLIAIHTNYNRYGLELNHYKDSFGQTVIYYKENFDSGSGVWWFNYYFYRYDGSNLIPVLNELENANLRPYWHFRSLWLKSSVIKTNPLTIKMVYNQELSDKHDIPQKIISGSTFITYKWDNSTKGLKGNYTNSTLTKNQIASYYLEGDERIFINAYYKTLKRILRDKKNKAKREAVLVYLNEVRNRFNSVYQDWFVK